MVGANLTPDMVTVGELISSLSDRGRWDEASRVLEIATRTGAIPPSSLDGEFEVDVSNLPAAVAKVKVSARGSFVDWLMATVLFGVFLFFFDMFVFRSMLFSSFVFK